jgi:hypothetical protein
MKKYTIEEFADQIRSKYPNSYDDLDDDKLIELWLKKFPNDGEKIIFESYEDESGAPKKSNKWKYLLGILLLILFILQRGIITSGALKDSDFFTDNNKNYIKYDEHRSGLNFGAISNYYFDRLYLFEEDPELEESNKSIGYGLNILYNGVCFELCHWTKNTESLDIEDADKLTEFPVGHYTFNGKSNGNWQPFTITDIKFSTSKYTSDSSAIISGTLDISKNAEEYNIDFHFEYNNGKVTSGNFKGPLSKFN